MSSKGMDSITSVNHVRVCIKYNITIDFLQQVWYNTIHDNKDTNKN